MKKFVSVIDPIKFALSFNCIKFLLIFFVIQWINFENFLHSDDLEGSQNGKLSLMLTLHSVLKQLNQSTF